MSSDRDWMVDAQCQYTDPEVFFPVENADMADTIDRATRICDRCPVQAQCHAYANKTRASYGIWGGRFRNRIGRI